MEKLAGIATLLLLVLGGLSLWVPALGFALWILAIAAVAALVYIGLYVLGYLLNAHWHYDR